MTSPPASDDEFDWEKWLLDTCNKEADDKIIQDANKSVDEGLVVSNNPGLDDEFVNLGRESRDSKIENDDTTVDSESQPMELAPEQLHEANDQVGVLEQTQEREPSASSPAELPAYIKELLEQDGLTNSESKVIAVGIRDSDEKARRKSNPKPNEVCQPQVEELPIFVEGLLENTACSSGKRNAEFDGNSESKKRVSKKKESKTLVDSTAAKRQLPNNEEMKRQRRKERERLRAQENRAKKKRLDADNDAKRVSLDQEVDNLRNQIVEKEEMMKHLELQITARDSEIVNLKSKVERLQHEKDLEIVYLQKKIKRLEHEQEENDAHIVFLQNKLEFTS